MKIKLVAGTTLTCLLLVVPLLSDIGTLNALTQAIIWSVFALSFGMLVGQAGMLSFGHAAYFAIGAFATLHLMQVAENGFAWIPTPLMPLAGLLAGLISGVVAGFFVTKRSGVYFSMATLAVAELLHAIAPNLPTLFGGEAGISSMRLPFMELTFGSDMEVYYLVLAWSLFALACLAGLRVTPLGRAIVCLRENEERLDFLGYDVHQLKLCAFAISAGFSGLAGGLLAATNESANYVLFGIGTSTAVLIQTYIGGAYTVAGPIVGAMSLTAFAHLVADATRLWLLYQGIIFILVLIFYPNGIAGLIESQSATLRTLGAKRYLIYALPRLATVLLLCFCGTVFIEFLNSWVLGGKTLSAVTGHTLWRAEGWRAATALLLFPVLLVTAPMMFRARRWKA